MGMAKERDKTEVNAVGAGGGIGDTHNGHCDVPRFRALVRDNTPTPADLTIWKITLQWCSWSCIWCSKC